MAQGFVKENITSILSLILYSLYTSHFIPERFLSLDDIKCVKEKK